MRIVLAGASGFIGSQLVPALRSHAHEVVTLVRRPATGFDQVRWDPAAGLGPSVLEGAHAVINLAGVGIGDKRWTDDYRRQLLESRLTATTAIARACAEAGVPRLLNASAVGIYGHRGDEVVDEKSTTGDGFLPSLCRDWEHATAPAARAGTRVILLRSGLVLGRAGGLLPRLALLTTMMAGGKLGNGKQYFPWIAAADEVGAIGHLLSADLEGPVNLVAPQQVTNAEFTRALGSALHRPTPWRIPGFALRLVLGEFADEVLSGQRAVPRMLTDFRYPFVHPTLESALGAAA